VPPPPGGKSSPIVQCPLALVLPPYQVVLSAPLEPRATPGFFPLDAVNVSGVTSDFPHLFFPLPGWFQLLIGSAHFPSTAPIGDFCRFQHGAENAFLLTALNQCYSAVQSPSCIFPSPAQPTFPLSIGDTLVSFVESGAGFGGNPEKNPVTLSRKTSCPCLAVPPFAQQSPFVWRL